MFFLGVDGGQTKTLCIIGDEKGNILALGRGRALIHILSPEGPQIAEQALKEAVESSFSNLHGSFEIEVAFLGLTGVPYSDSEEARVFEKI
ncbi:MAG: BadF/BadG/BcrA/BcrD ATPase family protein, partial [Dictyoglomus turgidum]